MFDDLGELDDIFYQLEKSAQLPDGERLEWICGNNSKFIKQINFLVDAVAKLEQATIDKGINHGLKVGFSYQSEILAELYFLLTMDCTTPARLSASLPSLKELLLKAMLIDVELKAGTLKLLASKGEKFTGNSRGLSALYRETLKILESFGKKTSADDVWDLLKSHGSSKVIQEVSAEEVWWLDDNGHEKTTQRNTFTSRLGEIRKKVQTE